MTDLESLQSLTLPPVRQTCPVILFVGQVNHAKSHVRLFGDDISYFFHASFPVSSTMVTGTPCHSSMPYARRSLVYSHFVTINRIMTVWFWKSQRIKSLQFYFIHGTYSDYILCNIECIIIYPPLFMFVLLYSWCGPRTLCNNHCMYLR